MFINTLVPSRLMAITAVVGMNLLATSAMARDTGSKKHRGQVSGAMVADLAGDDDMLVEVSIHGALLKTVTAAMGEADDHIGELLGGIVSIQAVVADVDDNAKKANHVIEAMTGQLIDDGWDRLARVREEDVNVAVFVLNGSEEGIIDGLTVMVLERSEGKLIFANIAGRIDLGMIAQLAGSLDIPGLDQLAGGNWKHKVKKHGKHRKE